MTTLTETWTPKAPPLREGSEGVVLIAGTRVPLDTILWEYQHGMTAEEIAIAYDTVELAKVHACIGYYLDNRERVDAYLHEREKQAEEVRKEVEARNGPQLVELRRRMLERKKLRAETGR